jgi:hypothetical protein
MAWASSVRAIPRVVLYLCIWLIGVAGCTTGQAAQSASPRTGVVRTAHAHSIPFRHPHLGAPHFAYLGRMIRGCVDARGKLTVYEVSEPRSVCLLANAVLTVVMSPTGTGQHWVAPKIVGHAVRLSGFHRVGRGARFVLTASGRGNAQLISGFVGVVGSSGDWFPEVHVR